jgi:hypothetical protein
MSSPMLQSKPCTSLTDEPLTMPLHPAEERLLRHIRALVFGGMQIQVQNGIPVFIEEIREKIKLA